MQAHPLIRPEPALLKEILTDLEVLSQHTRSFVDEYGTAYAYLEGSHGGETLLLWTPREHAPAALRSLLPLRWRGRIILALDASPGDQAPLLRALFWTAPQKVLIVSEGQGLGYRFSGWKEVAEDSEVTRVPLDDPRPPRVLERVAPTGLRYREVRAYPAWAHRPPLSLPELPGPPQAGGVRSVPVFGVGLVNLGKTLAALLEAWSLTEGG